MIINENILIESFKMLQKVKLDYSNIKNRFFHRRIKEQLIHRLYSTQLSENLVLYHNENNKFKFIKWEILGEY